MESRIKNLFTKFSDVVGILPYIGKYSKWKYLMMLLCKQSHKLWKEEHFALSEAYKKTEWRDDSVELSNLLENIEGGHIKTLENDDKEISADLKVQIILLDMSNELGIDLVTKAKEMHVKKLDKLVIDHGLNCPNTNDMNTFLTHLVPKHSKHFLIRFGDHKPIDVILPSMQECLVNFTNVYMDQILFNKNSLKVIIEASRNCTNLSLYNGLLNLDNKFTIDTSTVFKIQTLDLSLTMHNSDQPNRISLLNALSHTNMKNTLKKVGIWETDETPEGIKKLFDDYGFDVTVSTDLNMIEFD